LPDEAERTTARAEAIRRPATLVGAVVVASTVNPGPLRDEVLAASLRPVHGRSRGEGGRRSRPN